MQTIARVLAAAALLAAVLAAAPARADKFTEPFEQGLQMKDCGFVWTHNATKKWIWITIYDLGKTQHLDYGWVAPGSASTWRSGNYSCTAYYYVRAQVKNNETGQPVDGPDIFDTTVQLPAGSGHHEIWLLANHIVLRESDGKSTLVEHGGYAWAFDMGPSGMDQINKSPSYDAPIVQVVNASTQAMYVSPMVGPIPIGMQCIPPGGQHPFEFQDIGKQTFAAFGPLATCSGQPTASAMALIPWTTDWGTHKAVLRTGLVAGTPQPGMSQYSFTNNTTRPAKFVLDGAPAGPPPCVAAGATSTVYQIPFTGPQGPRKVITYAVSRCGDPNDAGVQLASDAILLTPGFKFNYSLRLGFFPN